VAGRVRSARQELLAGHTAVTSDWRLSAACRGVDTSMFFPERGDMRAVKAAKKVCSGCCVKNECLDEALAMPTQTDIGVWGGTTQQERRALRKAAGGCP